MSATVVGTTSAARYTTSTDMTDVLIDETERELAAARPDRSATFADAVAAWREYAEHTKRLKPGDAA
jgi:hypothetical protein